MPSRRDYLSATGVALGSLLAGCSEPAKETTSGDVTSVDVTGAEHRHSAFYVHYDTPRVYAFDGQAVFVWLDATDASSTPASSSVSLTADGATYGARTSIVSDGPSPSFFDGERPYSTERETGWLRFELPCPLDVDEAILEFPDGTRPLDENVRSALAEPAPSFELVEFKHPEAVTEGEQTTVEATVRHSGGPGPVRLAFTQWVGPPRAARVTESIPAGETRTISHTFAGRSPSSDIEQARLVVTGPNLSSRVDVPFHQS